MNSSSDTKSQPTLLSPESDYPLVACHECDAIYVRHPIAVGAVANCSRCSSVLYGNPKHALDRSLALYSASFCLMIMANVFPFLAMSRSGIYAENLVLSGGLALYQFGMAELGIVVFVTSILFPLISVLGMLYLLVPIYFARRPLGLGRVYRAVRFCEPWSLLGVFMLGTMIAIVKLQSLAEVIPGLGIYAFVAMLVCYSAARSNFDPEILWTRSRVKQTLSSQLDVNGDFISCHCCGLIVVAAKTGDSCQRCGSHLHARLPESIQRTWALLISAAVLLVPANLYPVMTVKTLGQGEPDTILSGVVKLIEAGMWGLGLIVLFASIVVPVLKLSALSFLSLSIQRGSNWRPKDRTLLYRITEAVGAWSMVDVFLVGLLSGLVSLGLLATIEPGIGASFFAAAVIMTMLAAHSFDPRLIWDQAALESETKVEMNNKKSTNSIGQLRERT